MLHVENFPTTQSSNQRQYCFTLFAFQTTTNTAIFIIEAKKNWQHNLQMVIPKLTKFVNIFPKTTVKVLVIDVVALVIDRKISITR